MNNLGSDGIGSAREATSCPVSGAASRPYDFDALLLIGNGHQCFRAFLAPSHNPQSQYLLRHARIESPPGLQRKIV
ncbi:MAG TPA: hypothetical protein VFZ27_07675 [Terriglobia bacterium]|nr:hypothetical protein [Terriglobia bacterium]